MSEQTPMTEERLKAWKQISEMAQRENEHLRKQQQKLIEALRKIESMEYSVYKDHTHMLYDAQMIAREALKVIEHE